MSSPRVSADRHWSRLAFLILAVALLALPLLGVSAQGAPRAPRVTVRTPAAIAHTRDSLLAASARRDSILAARWMDSVRHVADSLALDSTRRALFPSQRYAMVQPSTVGYLLRTIDGAPAMSDSQYTADTLAAVRRIRRGYLIGERWVAGGFAVLGLGSLDRDRGGYVDSYRTTDKQVHAAAGAALALAFDDGLVPWRGVLGACAYGMLWEAGQMRPSAFPRASGAHDHQSLGHFSGRDAVSTCAGAVAGAGLRAAWRAVR